ncbi:MAG: hypothetical protein Q8P84_00170 [Deltaproteobacteria bacterium]|nr:hypothetical protein [Deltaproteobacteria bacterium]
MGENKFIKLEEALDRLQTKWPKPLPQEVEKIFHAAKKTIDGLKRDLAKKTKTKRAVSGGKNSFDFVASIHEVLKAHDLLFLSRQLTYHVVTMSDLPQAFGSKEEALSILTELLAISTKQALFGSKLEIQVKQLNLKEGAFVETRFVYGGKPLTDLDRQQMLETFYGAAETGGDSAGLAVVRSTLRSLGGQLWIEFPKEDVVALTFYWPAFDISKSGRAPNTGTYKYDITLVDYAKIRQRFGVERSKKLVGLLEQFVKSLVRYPVDMVISFSEKGIISAIYESQEGAASSVATRISQRLKKESFRLGSKRVTPSFRYQLTFLA